MSNWLNSMLSVSKPVKDDLNRSWEDIKRTGEALKATGYLQQHEGSQRQIIDGLKNYQRDRRLKVDGIMNPGGPTERSLNISLQSVSGHAP